jgi:uncharacterized protein YqfA (UPF0365 family)
VLANPNMVSQAVLNNALDAQTAYEIVSIDVAEIDVGQNIGANLQADQAAADLRVAQANAEQRRAFAVALEQENRAQVELNRAKVIEAEAQIPMAIADAFRTGHEAHFAQVTNRFFEYLKSPEKLPAWERSNMLVKYFISTRGVEFASGH